MAVSRERVVQNAEKYVSRGKIESAIKEYRKLLAENPNDISTLNRVGDLYARIDRNSEAIDLFTQIAEQYAEDGFFVKAIAIYKKIIKLDPTLLEIYEQLADLYHRQGLVNEARTQYQVLADYYLKHDRTAQAIAIYRRMADLEPDDPSHHVKLAELYQQEGKTVDAMGEYRAIADLMLEHGRGIEAARVYERALDVDSEDLGFITDAVLKLKEGGHVAAAANFLTLAVERNPLAERVARIAGIQDQPPPAAPETPPAEEPAGIPESAPELEATADEAPETAPPEDLSSAGTEPALELAEEEPRRPDAAAAEPAVEAPAEPERSDFGLEDLEPQVFELDLDDDASSSLVTPPADMLEDRDRRGAAWREPEPEPETATAPSGEPSDDLAAFEAADAVEPATEEEVAAQAPAGQAEEIGSEPVETATGTFELALDLDAADAGPGAAAEAGPSEIDHDLLERTAAEVHAGQEEEIEDLLTEAEVLARYGIEEKALERLAELLQREPHNLEGYALMVGIHLDAGRHERVVAVAGRMAEIAAELGDEAVWPELRERLVESDYRVEDGHIAPPAGWGEEVSGAVAEPEAVEDLAAAGAAPDAGSQIAEEDLDLDLEGDLLEAPEPALEEREPPAEEPPAEEAPPAAPRKRRDVDSILDQLSGQFLGRRKKRRPVEPPASAQPEPPAVPPPAVAGTGGAVDPLRALGDSLREEIDSSAVPPPAAASADAGDAGVSWLDDVASPPGADADAFAADADFFDLGAELDQELSAEDGGDEELVPMEAGEQSLEDIVEGFKKGVAENLSPEDFDTHFNLGIAYREMGLLDEAIGEFQLAARDPGFLVSCASMLGLCFNEKGLPELAVKWYRRGLEAPEVSDEDRAGLLYDLGEAQAAAGDRMAAYHTFVDLYGINTNYRDVVARLAELEPTR